MSRCIRCGKPAVGRGLCGTHYAEARRNGTLGQHAKAQRLPSIAIEIERATVHTTGCRICGAPVVGRGFCRNHYSRAARAGVLEQFGTKHKGSLEERFNRLVAKDGHNGCWRWLGQKVSGPHHYGLIWRDGRKVRAHRVSFELHIGPLSSDDIVCHSCDNPECTNPDHLFIGTRGLNNKDTAAKDRFPMGLEHHAAKLSDEDIAIIRRSDLSNSKVAKIFGVTAAYVYDIRRGRARTKSRA